VWKVLRFIQGRINSTPDPGHPAGLLGNRHAGRRWIALPSDDSGLAPP